MKDTLPTPSLFIFFFFLFLTGAKGSFTLQVSLVSDATFVVVNFHFAARHVST